jgi:hypothetical protein
MKIQAIRVPTGYLFATEADREAAKRHRIGQEVTLSAKATRNGKFHRKYFALLNLGFEYWETGDREHKGRAVAKNFERFRKDVAIMAGHYDPVWNLAGEMRLEARSISFASMDEAEFEKLYETTVQILIDKVLAAKGFTREEVDRAVEQLLRF